MSIASQTPPDSAPPPRRLGIAALLIGLLSAGLALAVTAVGMYRPYSWYAVLGLAAVTVVIGPRAIASRQRASPASATPAWIGTIGGVLALVLGVWGMVDMARDHPSNVQTANRPARQAPVSVVPPPTSALEGPQMPFGATYTVDNVVVTLTGPIKYTPSAMASAADGSPVLRPVIFMVRLNNQTREPLNATGIDITAFLGGDGIGQDDTGATAGAQLGRVFDVDIPLQGLDVPAGQISTFPVAFNLPSAPTRIAIRVAPQAMSSTSEVYYIGVA
jgi:hypothetical protein